MHVRFQAIAFVFLAAGALPAEDWVPVPLGEPGKLAVEKRMRDEPRLLDAAAARREAIVLFDGSRAAVVAADFGKRRLYPRSQTLKTLAEEVRWHLSEMTGRDVHLVDSSRVTPSASAPVVEISELDVPSQTAVIRISRDRVVVGGDGAGVGHAVTRFLEALGVRYLWPGRTGKVIPRKNRVALPDVSMEQPPRFDSLRRIWAPSPRLPKGRVADEFAAMGIDAGAFCTNYARALADRPGNRGFFEWHGFNDRLVIKTPETKPTMQDSFEGGHYFGDYYARFSGAHPDWFALQPDGTRVNRSRHPRLCLSNPGLIREVIRDRVDFFRRNPDKMCASVCLPDGDKDSVCMCETCRRLDPVNAEPIRLRYWDAGMRLTNYVALTDRVLWFCNRVAEGVAAECPGKRLKTFVYAAYSRPPVRERPHPSLVVFNVAGDATKPFAAKLAESSVAAFLGFGGTVVWRPNMLEGFVAQVPQNYARIMYDCTVGFAVNGVRGVSFDGCSGEFALKGFIFYMLGRALLNYDSLSYEGQLADWCACFGRAAPDVRRYLDALEKVHLEATVKGEGVDGLLCGYPIRELEDILSDAAVNAASEPEVLARVRFLQRGVALAKEEILLYGAWRSGDREALRAARRRYRAFAGRLAVEDPVAFNPTLLAAKGPYLRGQPAKTASLAKPAMP